MNHVCIFLIISLVVPFILIDTAYACSCGASPDFLATWMGSKGAFQAMVTEIEQYNGMQKIHFDISLTQKGLYSGTFVHEQSRYNTCSVDYKVGETYQVFTWPNSGRMSFEETNICSTKQISGFEEYSHEDEHGNMQHFREDYNFFTQYGLWSVIVFGIIAGVSTLIVLKNFLKISLR